MEPSTRRPGARWTRPAAPEPGQEPGPAPGPEAGPLGPPSAEGWLAGYQHRTERLARQAAATQAELAAIAATESSPDRSVSLTVNSAGALTALTIGPPAEGLSRVQLAATILATARRAQAAAASRMVEVMRPLIGGRSAAMTLLRAHLPDPDAPDSDTAEPPGRPR